MSDLAYLGAAEALARFRDRSLSPVDLTEAVIARAEETEPTVNALTYRYFDDARRAAQAAEARYAGRGPKPRALEGLCIAVKDSSDIAGLPTSAGSLTNDETPASLSSPINQRVLSAGGIAHARSATPEFSCSTTTHSRRWGVTRNPWSPDWTPGGSSGGAAAALAAGGATLATGSDIGGSIRVPAALCGVVGFKPPKGRTPVDPPFNLDPYCHTGPLARSVGDALLFQNVLSGPHPGDPTTLRPKMVLRPGPPDLRGWRIAYSEDLGFFDVEPEIRARFAAALDVFRDLGARLEEASPPWSRGVIDAALDHLAQVFGASIAPLLTAKADLLTPYARAFARRNAALSPGAFYDALAVAGRMGAEFANIMAGRRLFLCPTIATTAVPADHDPSRDGVRVDGVAVDPLLGWALAVPFNMVSSHPVLTAPMGMAANGVPTGLQIVGRSFADNDVFRAGLAYEAAAGPRWFAPDRRPLDGPSPASDFTRTGARASNDLREPAGR